MDFLWDCGILYTEQDTATAIRFGRIVETATQSGVDCQGRPLDPKVTVQMCSVREDTAGAAAAGRAAAAATTAAAAQAGTPQGTQAREPVAAQPEDVVRALRDVAVVFVIVTDQFNTNKRACQVASGLVISHPKPGLIVPVWPKTKRHLTTRMPLYLGTIHGLRGNNIFTEWTSMKVLDHLGTLEGSVPPEFIKTEFVMQVVGCLEGAGAPMYKTPIPSSSA